MVRRGCFCALRRHPYTRRWRTPEHPSTRHRRACIVAIQRAWRYCLARRFSFFSGGADSECPRAVEHGCRVSQVTGRSRKTAAIGLHSVARCDGERRQSAATLQYGHAAVAPRWLREACRAERVGQGGQGERGAPAPGRRGPAQAAAKHTRQRALPRGVRGASPCGACGAGCERARGAAQRGDGVRVGGGEGRSQGRARASEAGARRRAGGAA